MVESTKDDETPIEVLGNLSKPIERAKETEFDAVML